MGKKKGNNRKAEKSTTIGHLRARLKRAERLGKSDNYINDIKKSISNRGGQI